MLVKLTRTQQLKKYDLDPALDHTPDHIKAATCGEKEAFLHQLVEEVLRDLLPFFRNCSSSDPQLDDHPLQEGRRHKFQTPKDKSRTVTSMEEAEPIDLEVIDVTVQQLHETLDKQDVVEQNMEKVLLNISGTRSRSEFACKICKFKSKYRTVCLSHIQICLAHQTEPDLEPSRDAVTNSPPVEVEPEKEKEDETEDKFWNYKSCEFLLDAIFAVTTVLEHHGDGLGCYIINKILLPIFHGLRHSNYSTSIHRLVSRVLCEATPKEALKLMHERFSNRSGKSGKNINRDRRMEYRIGTAKKLISNLGPNFNQDAVQQVNHMVDIKEELFMKPRDSHGVDIRSGRHKARSDTKDYEMLFSHLTETRAHLKIKGRTFGDLNFPEDLMDDKRFDKVEFYRWIVDKNKEAKKVLRAKRRP